MSSGIVFHSLAALAYTVLAIVLWHALLAGRPVAHIGRAERFGVLVAIVLHGLALHQAILRDNHLQLGWSLALSAAVWLGMLVFWLESLVLRVDGLLLLLLPAGALSCLLAALFPEAQLIAHASSAALRVHLLIALSAYGLITVAALQAMLMSALDRHLRFPHERATSAQGLQAMIGRMLDVQPPLLAQEHLLFRVIWVAFGALSLAVVTGSLISMAATGKLLPFDHKSVFTLLSWATFGVLLLGRHLRGWRGRIALRYTLVGFVFVVLAYTGSRFVIEVILQRG
jgi:ABC-type uncharacterized transport system permease subunit